MINGLDPDSHEETMGQLSEIKAAAVRVMRENEALKTEVTQLKERIRKMVQERLEESFAKRGLL